MADIMGVIKFIALILGIPVLILNLCISYYTYKKIKLIRILTNKINKCILIIIIQN